MHAKEHQKAVNKGCPPMAGILLAGGVILTAVMVHSVAGLAEALQWRRSTGGGLFALTSHVCHWSWNHLAWDVFAFGLLSLLCLRLMPSRYASCMLAAAVLIPLEVQINQPRLDSYRGLSGIDCALLGLVVAALWRQSSAERRCGASQGLAVLGGCGFTAKTMYELTTGSTVFVGGGYEPFAPVPSAHLVGFLSGIFVGLSKLNLSRLQPLIRTLLPGRPIAGAMRPSCDNSKAQACLIGTLQTQKNQHGVKGYHERRAPSSRRAAERNAARVRGSDCGGGAQGPDAAEETWRTAS